MKEEYRYGSEQRWKYFSKPLTKLVVVLVAATICAALFFEVANEDFTAVVVGTLLSVGLAYVLPLLIIARIHIKRSRDAYFAIDKSKDRYEFRDGSNQIAFGSDQIDKVVKVVSPPTYDNRFDRIGFGYFYYWKVVLKDGSILYLSCMLLDTHEFYGRHHTLEKQGFPVPKPTMLVQ